MRPGGARNRFPAAAGRGRPAGGAASYQARFDMPANGSRVAGWQGNWYCFQVGSALFVSLDANDPHYANDGSNNPANTKQALYIHGYSNGAQAHWLERTRPAPGDQTTAASPFPAPVVFDTFTLTKPRGDARGNYSVSGLQSVTAGA